MKFPKKYLNQYTLGDAFDVLYGLPKNCVDLAFTSIPDISQMSTKADVWEYGMFIEDVMRCISVAVKDEGFIVFSQQDRRHKGEIVAKHVEFINGMQTRGWHLKDEKIIVKDGIGKGSPLFQFTYQYMSIFTKTGKIKRKGEFLKDIIIDKQQEFGGQKVWSIPFCTMIIESLTKRNDIVIDPFAGAAPVLYAAKKCGRKFWGAEVEKKRYNNGFKFFEKGLFTL